MLDYTQSKHYLRWQQRDPVFIFWLVLWVNIVHVILLIFGYKKTKGLIEYFMSNQPQRYVISNADCIRLGDLTRALFRRLRTASFLFCNCFSTSLFLWFLLRKQGLDNQIRIGVRNNDTKGKFRAHAWVEIDGVPLNAGPRVRENYTTFNFDFSNNDTKRKIEIA